MATIHSGTMTGKLNGVMQPTTPTRLLRGVHVDAARDLLGVLALQQVDEAGGELDVLDAARDLAGRVGEHLAVLARDDRGELGGALLQQLAQAEEHVGALDEPGRTPPRQSGGSGGDGLLDLGGRRERDFVLPGARRRVEHRSGALGVGDVAPCDEVLDEGHVGVLLRRSCGFGRNDRCRICLVLPSVAEDVRRARWQIVAKMPRFRTDRPAPSSASAADGGLPTIREILTLPAVAAGVPEVLSSDAALDAHVRWVHVSDSAGVARLLDGGELLLSTGSGWPTEPAELADFIAGLVEAGLSGLVLELGVHYRYVPAIVEATAREHGLPLIALHREVKFVALTEAVHSRIISEQTEALRARDEVRERFTALSLRGSPADYVVHQLAQTLGSAVVLENLAHEVIAAEGSLGSDGELLADWEARSRGAHRQASLHADRHGRAAVPPGHDDWLIVPVEARGIRWGHLVALPGPAHPAGRTGVLEQGAIALALGRLAEGDVDGDEWVRASRQRLIDALLEGRFAGLPSAAARLAAAGLPVDGGVLHGIVVGGASVTDTAADAAARALGGRALAGDAPDRRMPGRAAVVLLSLPAGAEFTDRAARDFAREVGGDAAAADRLVVSVGAAASGLDGLLGSVQEALDLARAPPAPTGVRDAGRCCAARRTGRSCAWSRRCATTTGCSAHSEQMLAPLIEYDLARGGDLLDVLAAMLAHPANRTAAASASHLSRSVFYQRLALISDLLGVDLDDGETLTALHLALLVRRSAAR